MVSLGEICSWRKCCGQRWHDSTGLAFKSFGKSAAELEMTTNVKEDILFIKSYQRASHATEKPFVNSRLHCHLKEPNSHPASATTRPFISHKIFLIQVYTLL